MKKYLLIITAAISLLLSADAFAGSKVVKEVVYQTSIHCKNCANKVVENVSFEKGVTALETSVENKTVKVTFDPSKTSTEKIQKAIQKLGYTAEVISEKELAVTKKRK